MGKGYCAFHFSCPGQEGGGLNHLSLLLEFTLINQNNRNTLSLAHGVWTTDVKSTIDGSNNCSFVQRVILPLSLQVVNSSCLLG